MCRFVGGDYMTGAKDTFAKSKRYVSERGPFEIIPSPQMSAGVG